MNTSGNGIARTHETDALDLSTMTKHEMPYGIDAIAEIRMSTPADYPAIIRMGEAADMGTLDGFEDTLVATHLSGGIAAFCRLRIYDGIAHVNPIVVDEALRGQGVAAQMMERIARSLRETGRKAIPTCSYAKKWFGQHPEYADVLR